MSSETDLPYLRQMRARLKASWFDDLGSEYHRPDPKTIWFGVLDKSALSVYRQSDAGVEGFQFVEGFRLRNLLVAPDRPVDFGGAAPNGLYLLPTPKDPQRGTVFLMDIRGDTARFGTSERTDADIKMHGGAPLIQQVDKLERLLGPRGLLIYNRTKNPEPLFGFLAYEPDQKDTYRWQFIDLCVIYATSQMKRSREEMKKMLAMSEKVEGGGRDEAFQKVVDSLQNKAEIYFSLEKLRDLLNYISYLKYLSVVSPLTAIDRLRLEGKAKADYQRLVGEEIPAMEAWLLKSEIPNLDAAVEKIDELLKTLRKDAPLLGRMKWNQIRKSSPRQIAATVSKLLKNELLPDNQEAQDKLAGDMDKIRRLLTVIPPRVMGIPRVTGWVKRENKAEIESNAQYFWAVERLEEHAATFPLILGAFSLVFAFFCPPAAAALGVLQAVISVDDAIFKDAVSDSDINVDETFITQAEAREAAIFAAIDVVFGIVDVAEAVTVVKTARQLNKARALDDLPTDVDAIAELGGASAAAERARLDRYAEAASPDAVGRAMADADGFSDAVASTRVRTTKARAGEIDPTGSGRIKGAPASAREVIDEASDARALLRRELPASQADVILRRIDAEYAAHFDDAMQRIRDARAAGVADPPGPLSYERFARARWKETLSRFEPKGVDPPRRLRFYESLSSKGIDELLADPTALRAALKRRAKNMRRHTMGGYDQGFLNDFWKAVHRGAPDAELDSILRTRFLDPIEELGRRADLSGPAAREFGLWAHGIRGVRDFDADTLKSLRNLFDEVPAHSTDVQRVLGRNRNALLKVFNRRGFDAAMRTELIRSLDRIKHIDGVFTRSSVFTGLSSDEWLRAVRRRRVPRWSDNMFESLTSSHTRGFAFEAILTARIIELAEASGAGVKVSVGRRFWLKAIDDFNLERAGDVRRMNNILEADVMLEFADGRRILIDAKFYEKGFAIDRRVVNQAAKMAEGVEEGLVHSASFVTSHRVRNLREIEIRTRKGVRKSRLKGHKELLETGDGRVRVFSNAYDEGLPEDLLTNLRSDRVIGPHGEIIERVPPVTRPPAPERIAIPPPDPSLKGLVPARERIVDRVPARPQADVVRAEAKLEPILEEAGGAAPKQIGWGTRVPISPIHTGPRLVLRVARMSPPEDALKDLATVVYLMKLDRTSVVGRRLARSLEPTHVDASSIADLQTDARAGRVCPLHGAGRTRSDLFEPCDVPVVATPGSDVAYRRFRFTDEADAVLALMFGHPRSSNGVEHQCVLHDAEGRTLRTFPRNGFIRTRPLSYNIVPLSTRPPEGDYSHEFDAGLHSFALRFKVEGQVTMHPTVVSVVFSAESS